MSNTRIFKLRADNTILHKNPSKDKNINSVEVGKNLYFYSSKSFRLPQTKQAQVEFGHVMAKNIQGIMMVEAQRLQKFWFDRVNGYFDRRATHYNSWIKGSWVGHNKSKNLKPHPANKPSAMYRTTRQHTGQLRRALKIGSVTPFAIELYVAPCRAKTNGADYVSILMKGAITGQRAYIPAFDLRGKYGMWHGIPNTYWAIWQAAFMAEIARSEKRIASKIGQAIEKMGVLHQKDLRAIRERSSRNKQYIQEIDEMDDQYSKQFDRTKWEEKQQRSLDHWEKYPEWEDIKISNADHAQQFKDNMKKGSIPIMPTRRVV